MTLTRRQFSAGSLAAMGLGMSGQALAAPQGLFKDPNAHHYFKGMSNDNGVAYRRTNFKSIKPKWRRQMVKYYSTEPQGTIVVDTKNHFLYLIWENKTAIRYGVGVGKEGFKWYGRARIDRKALWPNWVPPPEMLKRQPDLPRFVKGGADNPLGPRALYLYRKGRDLGYRLHGTLQPWSIGSDVSSGCIRMFPEDVIDLYQRSPKGTRVLVLKHLGADPDAKQ